MQKKFTREEKIARIKKLRLFDDMLMTKAFDGCNECSQLLLKVILNNDKLKVNETKTQYTLESIDGHSVRLDIHAVDADGKRYNVEVQRVSKEGSIKRARYHSALMDSYALPKGARYDDLADTCVILITEKDYWGEGLPIYNIKRMFTHSGEPVNDGSCILYVNGEIRDETALGRLMNDMFCESPDDMYYKELADRVSYLKDEKGGIYAMCEFSEALINQGREEGREEGVQQGIAKVAKNMLKKHTPIEVVADLTGLSEEQVEKLSEELAAG